MRLIVTDRQIENISFDTVVMSIGEFNDICSHPYIASANFDEVVVDLDDKVKLGHLRPVMGITKVIPRVMDTISTHTVSVLSEIYPEYAAKMRYTFMRDKEGIRTLINEMCEEYHWSEFY